MGSIDTQGNYYGLFSSKGFYPPGGGPGQYFPSNPTASSVTAPFSTALSQAPTATPDVTDKVVEAAKSSQSLTAELRQGRRSTFLSGPQGMALSPPTVGTKTALGG